MIGVFAWHAGGNNPFTMLRGTEPLIAGQVGQVVIAERLRALARTAAVLPVLGKGAFRITTGRRGPNRLRQRPQPTLAKIL